MIEVEMFFMSTASYILHISEDKTYDMPQISQTREFMEQYRRNWKDKVQDFKAGC
jgi:predicted peroxiredoxin